MAEPSGATNEIIIFDERYALGPTTKVVLFADVPEFSLEKYYADNGTESGVPGYGPRYVKAGVPVTTKEQLFEAVSQLVIHTDLAVDAAGCFRALAQRGLSTHFIVNWNGDLHQVLDVKHCAYHAEEANQKSIGLDMNNEMKDLVSEPDAPAYSDANKAYADLDATEKKKYVRQKSDEVSFNHGRKVRAWGYTDPQYTTLIDLLKELTKTERFKNIKVAYPVDATKQLIYDTLEDPSSHQGFMAHWHWSTQRWDPGPGFDFERVYRSIIGESNSFPIEVEVDKNIGALLVPVKVREYAEKYYANNELQTNGWYPMGPNQTWHGGIHLKATQPDQDVIAMTDGTLVCARFWPQPTKLGHNNFMLLKHTVPIPQRDKKAEPKNFVFYSLYMHLAPVDVTNITANSPKWLVEMQRVDKGKDDEGQPEDPKDKKDDKKKPDDAADDTEVIEHPDPNTIDKRAWLEVGNHLAALKRGEVAKIAYKDHPVEIKAGDRIGKVGMFGPEGDWQAQIHVEVFADAGWKEAIDIGVHGKFFTELDDDIKSDLFVENPDILSLFGAGGGRAKSTLVPQHVLDPTTINAFWQDPDENRAEKLSLRKVVCRHVSEWSDKVDWVQSLSAQEDWDSRVADFKKILKGSALGKDAITTVLPFIWLSKEVADHIGLQTADWRGILDYFHPVHFVMWLTYNAPQRDQVFSTGLTKKQVEKRKKEEEKKRDDCKLKVVVGHPELTPPECVDLVGAGEEEGSSTVALDEGAAEDAGALLESWRSGRDQGEWKQPSPEE